MLRKKKNKKTKNKKIEEKDKIRIRYERKRYIERKDKNEKLTIKNFKAYIYNLGIDS